MSVIVLISLYFNYKNQLSIYVKDLIIKNIEKEIDYKNKEIISINKKLDTINEKLKTDIFKRNKECSTYLSKMQNEIWITSNLYFNYEEEILYIPTLNTCIYWLMQSYIKHPAPKNQMSLTLELVNVLSGEKYMNRWYIWSDNFNNNIEENDLVIQYRNLIKKWNEIKNYLIIIYLNGKNVWYFLEIFSLRELTNFTFRRIYFISFRN